MFMSFGPTLHDAQQYFFIHGKDGGSVCLCVSAWVCGVGEGRLPPEGHLRHWGKGSRYITNDSDWLLI